MLTFTYYQFFVLKSDQNALLLILLLHYTVNCNKILPYNILSIGADFLVMQVVWRQILFSFYKGF